jgi:hypothetical protein
MADETELHLPSPEWRRFSSEERQLWLIRNGSTVVAVVHEIGLDGGVWVFYHLVVGEWELILECGPLRQPLAGIRPRFAPLLGYTPDVGGSDCFVVIERWPSDIYWLFYARRRSGGVVLLFAFEAPFADMIRMSGSGVQMRNQMTIWKNQIILLQAVKCMISNM